MMFIEYLNGHVLFSLLVLVLALSNGWMLWLLFARQKELREGLALDLANKMNFARIQEELRQKSLLLEKSEEEVKGLSRQNQDLLQKLVRLETENMNITRNRDEQKEFFKNSANQLEKSFQGLASQALEGNNRVFLHLAQQVLEKETNIHKTDLQKRDESLQLLLEPIKQTLFKYQDYTQELEVERKKAYAGIEAELRRVTEASGALSKATVALKDALKKPNIRGRWGEVQLRNCIELAGMSEYSDVKFQDSTLV
ncbi:MAG: DNA recombination protein RmuC, partial [Bdellovibrionales bacterium]|nr:DNA recombination protein RmuC [Bdellovibrionales bacterium]